MVDSRTDINQMHSTQLQYSNVSEKVGLKSLPRRCLAHLVKSNVIDNLSTLVYIV